MAAVSAHRRHRRVGQHRGADTGAMAHRGAERVHGGFLHSDEVRCSRVAPREVMGAWTPAVLCPDAAHAGVNDDASMAALRTLHGA